MQQSHNSRLQSITESHEKQLEDVRKAVSVSAVEEARSSIEVYIDKKQSWQRLIWIMLGCMSTKV